RTSVGREFVAVVARSDQVDEALARLYPGGEIDADDAVAEASDEAAATEAQASEEQSPVAVAVADPANADADEDLAQLASSNGSSAPSDLGEETDAATDAGVDGAGEHANGNGSAAVGGITFDDMTRTEPTEGGTLEDALRGSLVAPESADDR